MKKMAVTLTAIALALSGCTTTYTDADLAAEEIKDDGRGRGDVLRTRELMEEGGLSAEMLEEEAEWVDRESDL